MQAIQYLKMQLKSDRFGMEIYLKDFPIVKTIKLKSDRFGMEML